MFRLSVLVITLTAVLLLHCNELCLRYFMFIGRLPARGEKSASAVPGPGNPSTN